MVYLACDPSKLVRARKKVMESSKEKDRAKQEKVVGMSYDGRRDRNARAMVPDPSGKPKMRTIIEEHESVTEEPSGRYLGHFTPQSPGSNEKPALKVAQGLLAILEEYDSTNSLQVLGGDSTSMNTGWKGGSHAHLEELLGRRLFWAICQLHVNELPLRHLIKQIDGPTSSDKGFLGPVCSLLSKVEQMAFNPKFRALPGGEDLIPLSDEVLEGMSTDQKTCYKLVNSIKQGCLPISMQDLKCGPLNHARFVHIFSLLCWQHTF